MYKNVFIKCFIFQELKDTSIACELLGNYSFFELVIKRLLDKMGLSTSNPEALGPKVSTKTQIAVTCEVGISKLALQIRNNCMCYPVFV